MPSSAELLAVFDRQVRTSLSSFDPDSISIDRDGPVLRVSGGHRGFVSYRDLAGLTSSDLDALIDRTIAHFAQRGESFEWKTYAHDAPADLVDRLSARGLEPEETETVLVGDAAAMATRPALPFGVEIVEVDEPADFVRIGELESQVWGEDWSWLADDLTTRKATSPSELVVLVAEAGGRVVSAAWLAFNGDTDFAGLFGGSTLVDWRGRGIYRALVAARARITADRGVRYLQVDASDDSAPILRRLGFVALTTTTPYIWQPGRGQRLPSTT